MFKRIDCVNVFINRLATLVSPVFSGILHSEQMGGRVWVKTNGFAVCQSLVPAT